MAIQLQPQEEWILAFIQTVCQTNNYEFAVFESAWQDSISASQNPIHKAATGKAKAKPDKPKRASSAYVFFCKDKRPEAKANLIAGARPAEVMKELGSMWGALKDDSSRAGELASYHAKAVEDKERVARIDQTTESASGGSPHPKPATTRKKFVKRVTGYDVYYRENKSSVQEQNPKLKGGALTKTMAKAWKAMDVESKQKWKDLAMLEWQPSSEGRDSTDESP